MSEDEKKELDLIFTKVCIDSIPYGGLETFCLLRY